MKSHSDQWLDLLPETVASVEVDESEDEETDDLPPPPPKGSLAELKGHKFNEQTGLWEYHCLSGHTPMEDGSESLQTACQLRSSFNDTTFGRTSDGYLKSGQDGDLHELFPPEAPQSCKCGAGYILPNGNSVLISHTTTVYMAHGPAKYKIWIRQCNERQRQCDIGPGQTEGIHFFTRETGAGDEIGWDFIDHVLNSYITFGAYCNIMNNKYLRLNDRSASFMSGNTFIAWWFSWISKFKIDFRSPCIICKDKPKMLAADGTKIGINVNHSTVVPIEKPTTETSIDPCHRRNERAFIRYSLKDKDSKCKAKSRDHLLYVAKKALGQLEIKDGLSVEIEIARATTLIDNVEESFRGLVEIFVKKQCDNRVHKKLAILFKILASNHSLSSVLPYRFVDEFQSILADIRLDADTHVINKISKFSPEIRDIFIAVKGSDTCVEIVNFFEYFIVRVREIFNDCKEPDEVNPILDSYNPAKYGRAYYFTKHGKQLREIPKYTMGSKSSSNYDDEPAREEDTCYKTFPVTGRKGTTYLFLWFDPQHYGHCYGYHMIPGSEGRKDPACSAYAFLEVAPEEMFFDFSCQLEEYCLNREPGFWKNTRFFHDTFHGFSHKCPAIYKSSRLRILQKVNSEICEQTNSFLQHIRYSARAMSMSKFNHFLQFFIHEWNNKKMKKFSKKCELAMNYVN